ncbi:hypothetical protein D910_07608 [Dendroctonus ponderosae]
MPQILDGSVLEGGGQILRVALAISCLKKLSVHIFNIRQKRSNPGLRDQHLRCIELVRDLSNGTVVGAFIGSTEIFFRPGDIVGGSFQAVIKTAGSIGLLLQVALPCALFAETDVTLHLFGGTNTKMAPQVDYLTEIFRPIMEKFGATYDFELIRRGYFPKGGGAVVVHVKPIKQLNGVQLINPGKVTSITGWSFVSGTLPAFLANKIADGAEKYLSRICSNVNIERYKEDRNVAPDNSSGIILAAYTDTDCILGSDALGSRKEDAEQTGQRAAEALLETLDQECCVDEHSQNQMLIFMALASGPSRVRVGKTTLHTTTAIHVIETLTAVKFSIENLSDTANIIHCTGSK